MLDMAKKQPPPGPAVPAPSSGRSGVPLSIYISGELSDALTAYLHAQRPRTSKTAAVEAALETFLEQAGFWPWPRAKADDA